MSQIKLAIISKFKKEFLLLGLVLLIIGLTFLFSILLNNSLISNWSSIEEEKNIEISNVYSSEFQNNINNLNSFTNNLLENKRFISNAVNGSLKKSYEALLDFDNLKDYNIELYNTRLELLVYNGRQISSDISDLNFAIKGKRFSILKDIGNFTYLILYTPVQNDTKNDIVGGLVVSRLIDVKSEINNRFYKNIGLTQFFYNKYGTVIELKKNTSQIFNSVGGIEKNGKYYSLKNTDNTIIGSFFVPYLDKSSYLENIKGKFSIIISIEVFFLTFISFFILATLINKVTRKDIRTLLLIILLIATRYIWLLIHFPSLLFKDIGLDIFAPSFYASNIAYGIAGSIGEIFITSIFVLLINYIIIKELLIFLRQVSNNKYGIFRTILLIIVCLLIPFIILQYYGIIIHSLVFDSNIKYFDRLTVINFSQIEYLFAQLSILLLTVSLLIIISFCGLILALQINRFHFANKFSTRTLIIITFLILLILSFIIQFIFPENFINNLKLNIEILIIVLTGIFSYYFYSTTITKRNKSLLKFVNISLIILICSIVIPVVLLNKITSQENKYLEVIARKVSDQPRDKIVFSLMSSLEDVMDNESIAEDVNDKNKFQKLAFKIWSNSRISTEKLNSAVYVLDTTKKIISDFNINPLDLNSDSIVNYAIRNIEFQNKKNESLQIDSNTEVSDDELISINESNNAGYLISDEIFENTEMKYYYGIRPIERINSDQSEFNNIIGYVLIAAKYDTKIFTPQSSLEIFKNLSQDNIENKLISQPIISEISNGEIVSSSNKELARGLMKTIDLFKEGIKDKTDKTSWRFDEFENELYKSFYVLNYYVNENRQKYENIYIISARVSDFDLLAFYFFKNVILFVLFYAITLVIYSLIKIIQYFRSPVAFRKIFIGYREKLFFSFFLVSIIPIIFLAIYTRELVKSKNDEFYSSQLLSDMKLISQYVDNKIPSLEKIKNLNQTDNQIKFYKIFDKGLNEANKNFNLFIKTRLISTTNEELYKSDLLDTRLSGNAFYNIILLKKDYFQEDQQIGDFRFIVGYKPVYDNFNNMIGIISSQTVYRQNDINQELTKSFVFILGSYFIAVVFLVFIVNYISYRISNPIVKLLKATEQLSLGNVDIQVKSDTKDEIGELVNSFNKMTKELKRSREELKKVERESAWRDIARQIAHEIKNPLTPMKLAIQHLHHSFKTNSGEFKGILDKTNNMILDQIEILNRIANEFSDFAKMPSRNYEKLNIDKIISDVIHLMHPKGIEIEFKNNTGDVSVTGDRDEVKRLFINLIKNSIQAIEENNNNHTEFNRRIVIESVKQNNLLIVKIIDNGIGMDENTLNNLFEPYFSTKSKGMGLGLVISKKIIDDMNAKIHITSKVNEGTDVEIHFLIS